MIAAENPEKDIFLGFDFGTQRIGVAIGELVTRSARPLPAIDNGRKPDWAGIKDLLTEWRPAGCVVGLPVTLDGEEQSVTKSSRLFAHQLRTRFGVPVYMVDERLSSRAADSELRAARSDGRLDRRIRRGDRDGVAARLILEQWLTQQIAGDPISPGVPDPAAIIAAGPAK